MGCFSPMAMSWVQPNMIIIASASVIKSCFCKSLYLLHFFHFFWKKNIHFVCDACECQYELSIKACVNMWNPSASMRAASAVCDASFFVLCVINLLIIPASCRPVLYTVSWRLLTMFFPVRPLVCSLEFLMVVAS